MAAINHPRRLALIACLLALLAHHHVTSIFFCIPARKCFLFL